MCRAGSAEPPPGPAQDKETGKGAGMMWRLVKLIFLLLVAGFIGLTGYAYFGDLSPEQREVTQPVTLDPPDAD
jgi:hypothetical protein